MSRSALWRQEGNVKERDRRAEETFEQACQEGRTRSKITLPIWGPDNGTFHFNPLLLHNTIRSQYFQKCCTNCVDWTSIIDEIYNEVNHLQVFQFAKQPSSGFCLLLRLLCFRMTANELDQTIKHLDSPYIRAIGFLFIRYGGCPPENVWEWIEPFIYDEDEFAIEQQGKNVSKLTSIGEFVRKLFRERDYFNTTPLPRFPVSVEREMHVKLLAADKIADRAKEHICNSRRMQQFQTVGAEIQALYGDNENPVTWYNAVVDRVITRSADNSRTLKYPKFVVTFREYGNTETVQLGEIDVRRTSSDNDLSRRHTHNKNNSGRGYNGQNNTNTDFRRSNYTGHTSDNHDYQPPENVEKDLYYEIRQAEQNKVTSSNKSNWARRPPSTKASLAQQNIHTIHDDMPQANSTAYKGQNQSLHLTATSNCEERVVSQSDRKRTSEEVAAIDAKKRKLLSRYG